MERVANYFKLWTDPKFSEEFGQFIEKIVHIVRDPEIKNIISDSMSKIINTVKEKILSTETGESKKLFEDLFNYYSDLIKKYKQQQEDNEKWFESLRTDIPKEHNIYMSQAQSSSSSKKEEDEGDLTEEQKKIRKNEMISKLNESKCQGIVLPEHYNLNSDYNTMKAEYDFQTAMKNKRNESTENYNIKYLSERQSILEDKLDMLIRRLDRQDEIEKIRLDNLTKYHNY